MEKKSTIISKALTELSNTIISAMEELTNAITASVAVIRNEKRVLRENVNELADINNAVGEFIEEIAVAHQECENVEMELDNYLEILEEDVSEDRVEVVLAQARAELTDTEEDYN